MLHRQRETELRTIQVAAFSRRSNADELVERLRRHGIPAIIESAGEGTNRVIVQGVPLDEIPGYRTRLADIGYESVLVRRK
ncbi:MAG: SPOR domain-containing protein [Spirochaetota bacterium]